MSQYYSNPMTYSIGDVDPEAFVKVVKEVTEADKRRQALMDARPPLDEILNLHDFEVYHADHNPCCIHRLSVSSH